MSRGKSVDVKKKPARVAAGPHAQGFARSMGENTGRVIRTGLPLFLVLSIGFGISFLLWRIVPGQNDAGASAGTEDPGDRASERSRLSAKVILQAVARKPRPAWISKEDFDQTASMGLFARERSIFEANLSRELAKRYETSPWVERVVSVRLFYPAQMEVEIEWRKPVARVDKGEVLDRHGMVLNLMADSAAVRDIPLISGVLSTHTEAGKRVADKELLEAIGLLAVVRDTLNVSPGGLKVATIQREPSGMWRVITDRGPSIYWGAFTDDPPMDEPHTQEKATLLRRRLCESKDPRLLEYIKVYHPSAPVKPRETSLAGEIGTAQPPQTVVARARH